MSNGIENALDVRDIIIDRIENEPIAGIPLEYLNNINNINSAPAEGIITNVPQKTVPDITVSQYLSSDNLKQLQKKEYKSKSFLDEMMEAFGISSDKKPEKKGSKRGSVCKAPRKRSSKRGSRKGSKKGSASRRRRGSKKRSK